MASISSSLSSDDDGGRAGDDDGRSTSESTSAGKRPGLSGKRSDPFVSFKGRKEVLQVRVAGKSRRWTPSHHRESR